MGVGEIVSFGTLALGVWGVWSWRRQLQGTARFNAACSLLRAALDLRHVIHAARFPGMRGDEFTDEDVQGCPAGYDLGERGMHVYEEALLRRAVRVDAAAAKLQEQSAAAEVLWGPGVPRLCAVLIDGAWMVSRHLEAFVNERRMAERGGSAMEREARRLIPSPHRPRPDSGIGLGQPNDATGVALDAAYRRLDAALRADIGRPRFWLVGWIARATERFDVLMRLVRRRLLPAPRTRSRRNRRTPN